ncbi:MAG: DNA/RNA non-specific endonuclease [Arcobacteraceae bacterium]
MKKNTFLFKIKRLSQILLISLLLSNELLSVELSNYVDKKKCDQIVDKQLYRICYSYKNKGAMSGWVRLDNKSEATGIKERAKFYNESTIPMQYRTKSDDYKGYGEDWNRGHFIVSDADFDYDEKALAKAYTMANIIPQSAIVNQKTWTKVEKYGRMLASKLGYIDSISIAKYDNPNQKIGNDIVIPTKLYRIYYNNDAKFEKCFSYDNVLNVDYKNDELRNHEIDCKSIKLR